MIESATSLAEPSLTTEKGAYLVEIFSAIQGEGPIVGKRQIFVRFLGCHIACAYCDTPATHTKQRQCRVEMTPGQRDFKIFANPVPLTQVQALLQQLETFPGLHDSISLTGGEPLQHLKTLQVLVPLLKPQFSLYLETDGILHQNLAACVQDFDQIGMDIKIPSATGLQPYWAEHEQFIRIASQRNLFVKAVVTQAMTPEEWQQAIALVAACDPWIPFILQPVTPYGAVKNPPAPEQVLQWQALAKRQLKDVRVIPQTHKMIGQL